MGCRGCGRPDECDNFSDITGNAMNNVYTNDNEHKI